MVKMTFHVMIIPTLNCPSRCKYCWGSESTKEMMDAAKQVLDNLMDEDAEIVTVIYGEDASAEQAEELQSFIEANYPDAEVEIVEGKQSLYPFILSVE